jgi:hemerythrin-like domain-containing protein
MTKRHQGLIPLTHDHHHALAQARRLRVAAMGTDDQRIDQAREFVDFFRGDTINHFREEEEIVFPLAIEDARAAPVLGRVVVEHLRIHALVTCLADEIADGQVSEGAAGKVAAALESHIRFEEGEVFPLLEEVVADERLERLSLSRNRSQQSSLD